MLDEFAELTGRRDEIIKTAASHGATNLAVFGSFARGEISTGSDVDFLVDMEPGRSLIDHVRLTRELGQMLDRQVDVVTRRSVPEYARDHILNEAITL